MNLIRCFETCEWSVCSRFHIMPINAALWFDWPLQASGDSPRILTCDTRLLLHAWAGCMGSGHESTNDVCGYYHTNDVWLPQCNIKSVFWVANFLYWQYVQVGKLMSGSSVGLYPALTVRANTQELISSCNYYVVSYDSNNGISER